MLQPRHDLLVRVSLEYIQELQRFNDTGEDAQSAMAQSQSLPLLGRGQI